MQPGGPSDDGRRQAKSPGCIPTRSTPINEEYDMRKNTITRTTAAIFGATLLLGAAACS